MKEIKVHHSVFFPAETVERWVQTKPEGIQELFRVIVVHQSVH